MIASAEGWPCPNSSAISSKATARVLRPWSWRRCDERLRGRQERPRRDQQVVGLVRRRAQRGRSRCRDTRGEERLLRDGEVAVSGLRPEPQRAARRLVPGEPERPAELTGVDEAPEQATPSRRGALRPHPRPWPSHSLPTSPRTPRSRATRRLRVGDREAVQEHEGRHPRVRHVRERELVRSLAQQRQRHAQAHPVGLSSPQTAPRPRACRSATRSRGGRRDSPTPTPPAGRPRAPPPGTRPRSLPRARSSSRASSPRRGPPTATGPGPPAAPAGRSDSSRRTPVPWRRS